MKPFENALPGFNHNVKHKGQLYHLQTEDSGRHNPSITTLLFLGGNVLASLKVSYAEHLDSADLPKRVRELMEKQHKQMLRNLLKGQYDKSNEAHAKYWRVGQLDERAQTDEHPALSPAEPLAHLTQPILPSYTPPSRPPLSRSPSRSPLPPVSSLEAEQTVVGPTASSFEDEEVGAVFGEDLIAEQRLDELILNYLLREKDKLG
ncbi:MAG: hypothetical protein FWD46_04240 [Cystobacterineae bacterium]|nr:hypothetical protein [Cystobacterineae bacterium]